ncbi:hypothetical protein L3X38_037124 [Prunus dulcis]|uniref:No apical meristem-associated C-terminal domain-containing protein n=1 Tax=Prunus dulcis TaxID=3755 RepID=A0AAD4V4V2_PRUDU|nr:hypothetical protein L3X38_037124 [Prunus dulcis]
MRHCAEGGTNQSNDSFWLRMYQKFLENDLGMSGAEVRSPQAIASQFKIINQQCSFWKACVTKANARHVSGSNLEDVDMNAKTLFLNNNKPPNRPFKLYHAWQILKDCPKWNDLCESPTQKFKDSSHSGNTVNLEEDEDGVVMPTPRPLGRDKHKDKKKKGKGVESYLNQSGKFLSELVQQGNEAKEDMRRKLELLHEQHAYQIQQDKEANEQRIMSMDLSNCCLSLFLIVVYLYF